MLNQQQKTKKHYHYQLLFMINRYMRLLLFFDLPVVSDNDKREYNKFRNFLLDDGFIMIQFSVYVRICRNQDDLNKHINRVKSNLPPNGNIRILQITDSQYQKMQLLRGKKVNEEKIGTNSLIIFE